MSDAYAYCLGPLLAEIERVESSEVLAIGLGRDRSVLSYARSEGEPTYFTSCDPAIGEDDERFITFCSGICAVILRHSGAWIGGRTFKGTADRTPSEVLVARMTELQTLDRHPSALFAVACATRVSPVFFSLASRTSRLTYDSWLRDLWTSAKSGPPFAHAVELSRRVSLAPEAEADDPYLPQYYAMNALTALQYAIDTLVQPEWRANVQWCADAALGLGEMLDDFLNWEPSLEQLELDAQAETIRRLHDGGHISMVETIGSPAYREFERASPKLTEPLLRSRAPSQT
jgi:hypothetical protein